MGWSDLFRSKSSRLEPDPRLRWFGKLPTYADYYSSATDVDWAVEFHDWLLKGVELHLSRAIGSRRVPSALLMVRLPKGKMTVFATLQDYGGDMRGRPFPLVFYTAVPTALWPGPTSDAIPAAVRVFEILGKQWDRVSRFFNAPGRFEAVFGGQELNLDELASATQDGAWAAVARRLSLEQWFEAARPGREDTKLADWVSLVARWGQSIAQLESEEFEPTLRFPLAPTLPLEVQIAGWMRWLERRMAVEKRALSLLVTPDEGGSQARLNVVARELVADDFLLLTAAGASLSYVDDLCRVAERPTGTGESEPATAAEVVPMVAPTPVGTWADLIEAEN